MNFIKKFWEYYKANGIICCFKTLFRKLFKNNIKSSINSLNDFSLKIKEEEMNDVTLKCGKTRNVFIFATVPYYDVGGGQRSAQISKIFNSMGYSINYIYAFDSSESKVFKMSMPLVMHKNVDTISNYNFSEFINKDDICIFEAPSGKFRRFLDIAYSKKAKIVYENIDNWETSLGSMVYDEDTLIKMLEYADMITATAGLLVEQTYDYFKKYKIAKKDVYYLPNAVDDMLFEPSKDYDKPKDLVQGEKKTLLYYGSLWGEWFDWELISKVAQNNPDISINLIGDYLPVANKIRQLPSNIHFLGLKEQIDLPAYLRYVDYAILPFKRCSIGNYVSPLKIFEYISMNKIVLATNLPDIIGYPNVFTFDSAEEWNNVISQDLNVDIEKRNEFIQENNWYNRCSKILDVLFPENVSKVNEEFYNNISVVVLNHNNKNVIFRCIDTLLKFNERYNYEIIVVDNDSTDGSYEMLKNKYDDIIKITKNDKNGCASGRNIGVSLSQKDYILFLDSDEWILHKYWLDVYLKIIYENKIIGAVAWSAGWFNEKGYAYKYVDWYEHRFLSPNMLYRKDVGYLATCGFIMKKELFNKIGGFDLFYDPTCYEDTDLSLNIRNSGLETVYSTYLGVGHIPHQTTKSGSESHTKLLMQKGDYFRKKWLNINRHLLSDYIKK